MNKVTLEARRQNQKNALINLATKGASISLKTYIHRETSRLTLPSGYLSLVSKQKGIYLIPPCSLELEDKESIWSNVILNIEHPKHRTVKAFNIIEPNEDFTTTMLCTSIDSGRTQIKFFLTEFVTLGLLVNVNHRLLYKAINHELFSDYKYY